MGKKTSELDQAIRLLREDEVAIRRQGQNYRAALDLFLQNFGRGGQQSPIPKYKTFFDLSAGWDDNGFYGNGTAAHDSSAGNFVVGTASLKLTTPTNNTRVSGGRDITDVDWSDKGFTLWVKSSNLNVLQDLGILISTNGNYTDFFQINLLDKFVNMNNNEWQKITLKKSDFSVGAGTPSWATVNRMLFRALATNTNSSNIWFNGFGAFDEGPAHYVSLTFDDGYESVFLEAKKKMDEYGFKGTNFIIPDRVGTSAYMSQTQIDALHEEGWDISGHGDTNLASLSSTDRLNDLLKSKVYLTSRGYRGQDIYALPNGVFNRDVQRDVQKYFGYVRGLEKYGLPTSMVIPQLLPTFSVANTTLVATLESFVTDAVADNSWLILAFHIIATTPTGTPEYARADFNDFMDYLATNNVNVMPMSEVLRRL